MDVRKVTLGQRLMKISDHRCYRPPWGVLSVLVTAGFLLASCSGASTGPEAARRLVDEAAQAMGGWTVLDSLRTFEIRTRGTDWEPLQTVSPNDEPRHVSSFEQTLRVDLLKPRLYLQFVASRIYPTQARVEFTEAIDGDVGWLVNTTERLHSSRLAARIRDYNRLPFRLLYTARNAADLTRVEDRMVEGALVQVLTYTDVGAPVELHIDPERSLPLRVIYKEDDPVYGDTTNELSFAEWRYEAGILIPRSMTTRLDGKKIREEITRGLTPNVQLNPAIFDIPDEIRASPEVGERIVSQWTLRRASIGVAYLDFARPQRVEFVEVAPGVFQLRGASHHSMVVEMKDHLVLVEAPLFEERSLAILQALEEKFPGKPVRYLAITHFHFDHSGGIRALAAAGATLLAHESIVPFVNDVLRRPHTIRPDSLAKRMNAPSPPSLAVEGVQESRSLSDGARVVELRSVTSDHAQGMLVAYLPKERVVFVADLYSPPGPVPNPSVIFERERSTAFYRYLVDNQLDVQIIVGGHGAMGPLRALQLAIAQE
jgi:glyoxylase-like metal-dependent hydrolase (beta-lactamase superfamily II)